jgi:hypothetical protein
MNKERDLLPWILGGLSTAAVAVAIAAISSHHASAPVAEPIPSVAAATLPPPAPAPVAVPQPASTTNVAIPATMPVAESPPATRPEVEGQEARPGQIWSCTTKGVKTFSNNPCGEKSAPLEVGPINTMNPIAPVHYARAYPTQTQYTQPYSDTAQSYAEDDSEQDGYDGGANSYTIVQGVAVLPRRRPEHHPHRPPYHHSPAPAPRKF